MKAHNIMTAPKQATLQARNSRDALRNLAIAQLMSEVQAGYDSVKAESDWVSEEEMKRRLGVRE